MMRMRSIVATLSTLTWLGAATALAQQPRPAAQAAPPSNDALVIYSAGLDAMFASPKDKGLAAALAMLDERLAELPEETGAPIPGPALKLALELLTTPMSLRAGLIEGADPMGGGPPFYAQLNFRGKDARATEQLSNRFGQMLAELAGMRGEPRPETPGVVMLDLDGVPLYHGLTRVGDPSGTPDFIIALNTIESAPLALGDLGLPQGVKPVFAFKFDAKQIQPIMEMMLAQVPPGQADMAKSQMRMMGLYGENASTISLASGFGGDRAHFTMHYSDYRQILDETGSMPSSMLSAADLKRIPADATYAELYKFDLASIGEAIDMMAAAAAAEMGAQAGEVGEDFDPMAMIEAHLGIHPRRDLLDHLGEVVGSYMSQTTGGGLFSTVMFVQLKNPDAFGQSLKKINDHLNALAAEEAKGYVRIADRRVGDRTITVLTFPGLPIPFELCWTISDGYWYGAASPTALVSALAQASGSGGGRSLADNAQFKEMGGNNLEGAMQIIYMDMPALLADGYGLMNLGAAALSNAVRSPNDPAREAPPIMPSFRELAEGAKATLYVARMQGDDLITTGQSDRSALVNLCGLAGAMGGSTGAIVVGAIAAGALLPAIGQARETAGDVQGMANLRNLGMAVHVYAADHQDQRPPNLQALIDGGYLTAEAVASPHGPLEGGDLWLAPGTGRMSAVQAPDRTVLAYDRAMYATGDEVNVLFFDGHVEKMPNWQFQQLTAEVQNEGVDFKLP